MLARLVRAGECVERSAYPYFAGGRKKPLLFPIDIRITQAKDVMVRHSSSVFELNLEPVARFDTPQSRYATVRTPHAPGRTMASATSLTD